MYTCVCSVRSETRVKNANAGPRERMEDRKRRAEDSASARGRERARARAREEGRERSKEEAREHKRNSEPLPRLNYKMRVVSADSFFASVQLISVPQGQPL